MGKGKYSPCYPNGDSEFDRNCYGDIVESYQKENYDQKLHFQDYDEEGFDSYGYSAFNKNGEYIGIGKGIDRLGYAEEDYITMSIDEFESISIKDVDILYHDVNDILKSKNEIKLK